MCVSPALRCRRLLGASLLFLALAAVVPAQTPAPKAKGPLGKLDSMSDLERDHVGVTDILKTWFLNYKGKDGAMKYDSFGSRNDALELLAKCEASFAAAEKAKK